MALTDKQLKFVEFIFLPEYTNNYQKAMIDAGYSENIHYSQIMSEHVSKEIVKRLDEYLALNAPKSILRVLDVLVNPEQKGAKAILEAAWGILDRAGISKKERIEVEHKASSGVFILPEKKSD